jgi:hypothetical protein
LIAAAGLAWAFGNVFAFLNQSGHQALYSARLTRAYLGASNEERWSKGAAQLLPVVEPAPRDDIELHRYWVPSPMKGVIDADALNVYLKGMPLHLVNVTINETYDGQSQIQQQDRKGTGMALGPGGISVGIRHHAVIRNQGPAIVRDDQEDGQR